MAYARSVASSFSTSGLSNQQAVHGGQASLSSGVSPSASVHDGSVRRPSIDPDRMSIEKDALPRDPATRVPAQRDLEWWDVSSLIINKMCGTGIFTGPFLTMFYTRSKALTMGFWVIGFLYTLLRYACGLECMRRLELTG